MSFYNTGNPVPSVDPRDLDDNAKILDEFVNGTEDTYVDRKGVERRTLFSIEHDADSALLRSDLANSSDPTKGARLVGGSAQVINVKQFGAVGDGVADDTAAIQAAVDHCTATRMAFVNGSIQSASPQNQNTGTSYEIFFPSGRYKISAAINLNYVMTFVGQRSVIQQTTIGADTFTGFYGLVLTFKSLVFVGGRHSIYFQNGADGSSGIEAVTVKVRDCEFHSTEDFAVKVRPTEPFTGNGGMTLSIEDSKFMACKRFVYVDADQASITGTWFGTYGADTNHPMDTALFELHASTTIFNCHFIPGINYAANPVKNRRWIDSYVSINLSNNKFGAEGGGGLPIIYSFHDQSLFTELPWFGSSITIKDNFVAVGSTAKSNGGLIVLKRGLPQRITIENNGYTMDVPYIRTDLMAGTYTTLTSYLASAFTGTEEKAFSFRVLNNTERGVPLTQSTVDDALLAPWTDSDDGPSLNRINRMNQLVTKRVDTNFVIGKNFTTTSTSGAVAIVDTGITSLDPLYGWFGESNGYFSMLEMVVSGNPQEAASGGYHHGILGYIAVGSEFDAGVGGAAHRIEYKEIFNPAFINQKLSVVVRFWDGVTETTVVPYGSTAQIRVKITYTTTSNVGSFQRVRLIKKNQRF